jgi:hypothetical protein
MIKQTRQQDYFEAMDEKDRLDQKTPFLHDEMTAHAAYDIKRTHQAIAA